MKQKSNRLTFGMAQDILSLIGKKLSRDVWNQLTPQERALGIDYAGACHFRASDNNNRVPKQPTWIERLPALEMNWP